MIGTTSLIAMAVVVTLSVVDVVGLFLNVGIPVLVGLVTKRVTSPSRKAILLLLFTALNGFGTELLTALTTSQDFDVVSVLLKWLTGFVIGAAMHYGLWKPTKVAAAAQDVGS